MGVDFFPCDHCGESICDCGSYEKCECGRRWCDLDCATKDGYVCGDLVTDDDEDWDGEASCAFCRQEKAEDSELLDYLLRQYNMTRDQVLEDWKNEQREDDSSDAD